MRRGEARGSYGLELLVLQRTREAIRRLVDLVPRAELLHTGEPLRDVRIVLVLAADDLARRDDARREVVGDRDRLAREVRRLAKPMRVEHLEPRLRALLAP